MINKNTQIADKPRKEPRQYKHTPNKAKRLTSKILAIVGCLIVLLSCVVVPSFADGSTIAPYEPLYPVAPLDRFIFPSTGYGTLAQASSPFSIYARTANTTHYDFWRFPQVPNSAGNAVTGEKIVNMQVANYGWSELDAYYTTAHTFYDDNFFSLCGSDPSLSGVRDFRTFTLDFHDFALSYVDGYRLPALYFVADHLLIDDTIRAEYNITLGTWTGSHIYGSPKEYTGFLAPTLTDDTKAGSSTLVFELSDIITDNFDIEADDIYALDVQNFSVTFTAVSGAGYEKYISLSQVTYFNQYVTAERFAQLQARYQPLRIPEAIEPSGLFGWLGDALNGVLSAPLVPIGDYTITIGSVLGMLIGISLVIAFLKFFAGG